MIWALLSAVGIALIANLPLLYTASRSDWNTFAGLWKLAPHQFLFCLVCVPVAVWLTCMALWWALRVVKVSGSDVPAPWSGVVGNWPVIFLVGIALAAIVSAAFFLSTTWSPDKLRDGYPTRALGALAQVNAKYEVAADEADRDAFERERARAASGLEARDVTADSIDKEFASLSSFEQAQATLTRDSQSRLKLTDEAAIALSAFQVFAVVGVAAVLLITACLLLLLGYYSVQPEAAAELTRARTAMFLAILAYVPYPFLFGLYRNELERAVKSADTGGQELVATAVILLAAALTMASAPGFTPSAVSGAWAGVVALLAIFGAIAPKIEALGFLRQVLGSQSTVGSQIVMVIAAGILSLAAIVATWPRSP